MGALLSLFRTHYQLNGRSLEVLRQLGEGGFSVVYYVRDSATGEKFALKVLPLSLDERQQEFEHEVENYRRFSSVPNVGRLIDSGISTDENGARVGMLLMTCYKGGSLQHFIDASHHLDPATALPVILKAFRGVCAALTGMHSHDPPYAFRDLKPANILLDANGDSHLVDLGSAAVARPDLSSRRLVSLFQDLCAAHCTAPYRAPELFEPGALDVVVNERSDIWSLGCALFACMYGRLPFDGTATAATSGRFTVPSTPAYPPPLVALVRRTLAVAPGDRPTAAQVDSELAALQAAL